MQNAYAKLGTITHIGQRKGDINPNVPVRYVTIDKHDHTGEETFDVVEKNLESFAQTPFPDPFGHILNARVGDIVMVIHGDKNKSGTNKLFIGYAVAK